MKFDVLTLFPEMFEPIKQSIIGKAEEKKLIDINLINIRDFSKNKHKKIPRWESRYLQNVFYLLTLIFFLFP